MAEYLGLSGVTGSVKRNPGRKKQSQHVPAKLVVERGGGAFDYTSVKGAKAQHSPADRQIGIRLLNAHNERMPLPLVSFE